MHGTPWTVQNSSLPAYPSGQSPVPGRNVAGSPAASPTRTGGPGRQAVVISGAEISIQPLSAADAYPPDAQAPAQDGPLAYYPTFSVIDPQHKWQRIRDWASGDSVTATGSLPGGAASAAGNVPMPPAHPDEMDVTASIDSTLLELELERARASLKAAAASGGGGGVSSVAAAIAAAAGAAAGPSRRSGAGAVAPGLGPAPGGGPTGPGVQAHHPSWGGSVAAGLPREPSFGFGASRSAVFTPMTAGAVGASHSYISGLPSYDLPSAVYSAAPGNRADLFQPGLGAIREVSAIFGNNGRSGAHTGAAAAMTGIPGRGMPGGLTGAEFQQAHATFIVERTALEARCRAAEEALAAAERRHSGDMERIQERAVALEAGLASERQLCSQLQGQLQAELQRLRTVTESEAAAKAAESATKGLLELANQSLELERRRASEAAQQAAEAARDVSNKLATLDAAKAALEQQLKQEKDKASRLQRQLRDAQQQEASLMERLGTTEGAKQQQEMRLEAASEQVSAMRSELQLLNAKLAARDKQLLKHVQEVEETQIATLRSDLASSKARLQQQEAQYAALRLSLSAVHQALGPQTLAAAFGYSETLLTGFSAGAADYASVSDGLASHKVVSEEHAAAVVQRVKELVAQARNLYLASERREVALASEMDSALSAMRQTNADAEARLASCNTALRTTTQRVEELTAHLQESRRRCAELESSVQTAQASAQAAQQRSAQLQDSVNAMQQEVAQLRVQLTDAQGAQRELQASREQVSGLQAHVGQLQAQLEQLEALARRSTEAAESKDDRIRELRSALAAAMNGTSAAEGQAGSLMRDKQQVLESLDAEQRRTADLEASLQVTEQELARVVAGAHAAENAYRQLSQQVAEAARDAAARARELQAGSSGRGPFYSTPLHLEQAEADTATKLGALEAAIGGRPNTADSTPGTSISQRVPGDDKHDLPQATTRMLLALARQLSTQQVIVHQQLIVARTHLQRLASFEESLTEKGQGPKLRKAKTPTEGIKALRQSMEAGYATALVSVRGSSAADSPAPVELHMMAQQVAALAETALQVVQASREQELAIAREVEALGESVQKTELELEAARKEAANAKGLQERLDAAEAELQQVRATAQAEFGRVHGEVSMALQAAEQVRNDALAEADARVAALQRAAAEAATRAEAAVEAAAEAAEARVREAEAANKEAMESLKARLAAAEAEAARRASNAGDLAASLQTELTRVRSLLDAAHSDLRGLQAERVVGMQRLVSLQDELRRSSEEVARWRRQAAPRIRERLVMQARLRILRRKRAELRSRLAVETSRAQQSSSQAASRGDRLKQGFQQLRQLQIDNVQLRSRLQEAEGRAARADTLLPRLEERRIALEQDRKAHADKATKLTGQLAEANKAVEAARKAEAAARKELDRLMREQLEPQQRRTATVLQELEGAAGALQESQANATRLLQQGAALREELEDVQRAAEDERAQWQGRLASTSQEVAQRDALVRDLRQQLAAAQAAAAAAVSLLPAIKSGELGDAAAVQMHLIGQLGQLQAANVDLEARRAAVDAELEVLRVRLNRAESLLAPKPGSTLTPATAASMPYTLHTVEPQSGRGYAQVLQLAGPAAASHGDSRTLAGLVTPSVSGMRGGGYRDDDGAASVAASYSIRDTDPGTLLAKDQRIQELRAALSSVLVERAALQSELAAVREEAAAAAAAAATAAADAGGSLEEQVSGRREVEEELHRVNASLEQAGEALAAAQRELLVSLEAAEKRHAEEQQAAARRAQEDLSAVREEAEAQARARDAYWRSELDSCEHKYREEEAALETRWRADVDAREERWRQLEQRWREEGRAAEARWHEELAAKERLWQQKSEAAEAGLRGQLEAAEARAREHVAVSDRQAERHSEEVQRQAREQVAALERRLQEETSALERRLRDETSALERRVRDAERAAADAAARAEERTRQAERAREQLSQVQALHTSAEEAVRQVSAQLRELQQGGSSQAHAAAGEAQEAQLAVDTLRREAAVLKDTIAMHEAEVRRLQSLQEASVAHARTVASQMQALGEDLSSARTRISVLQQELAAQQAEADGLRQANSMLQAELDRAEERHVDSESQLVEVEQALSRQQVLAQQVQRENDRLSEQYKQLQEQLQQLTLERRAAVSAAAAEAAAAGVDGGGVHSTTTFTGYSPFSTPTRARGRQEGGSPRAQSPRAGMGALSDTEVAAAAAALESGLLESANQELKRDLFEAEERAARAEADLQLLQLEAASAASRLAAAESKVSELQAKLQAGAGDASHNLNTLRQRALELEVELDEQASRETAAQEALARATARSNELQAALEKAERAADDLRHQLEDRELELGVLQAQLASASTQLLAQQAESHQAVAPMALELQVREQALLISTLQANLQSAVSRAETAERDQADSRAEITLFRDRVETAERNKKISAEEAQASAQSCSQLRADLSKLSARLSEVEAELLQLQEARDRAVAQLRSAESRLAEEQSEVRSLRQQLAAALTQGSGADATWQQRVGQLEGALAEARNQAADAEDAVMEAAAAQLRLTALGNRARELEAAAAEAESRAAAAMDAQARAAGALAAQRETETQKLASLESQVKALQEKLLISERQVADRDLRLEGYASQLELIRSQAEAFEDKLRSVRRELYAVLQERDELKRNSSSVDPDANQAMRSSYSQIDGNSVSGLSVSTLPQHQLVGMLSENRDLLEKLTSTHAKLKLYKNKLAQKEQELRSREAEVIRLQSQLISEAPSSGSGSTHKRGDLDPLVTALRSELDAYKAALAASQEEAAASAAAAAEAQARCESMTKRLEQEEERRASHQLAGSRVTDQASPRMMEHLLQQQNPVGPDMHALMQKVKSQRSELDSLNSELQAANAKRVELAKQAAMLGQRLVNTEIRERDLTSLCETLQQQLRVAQEQLDSRQAVLHRLTSAAPSRAALAGGGDEAVRSGSPGSAARSLGWLLTAAAEAEEVLPSGPGSPHSQATRPYHSSHTVSPTQPGAARTALGGSSLLRPAGVASSVPLSLSVQLHQQQSSKLDRVVAMWKDACKAKDARIQELQADLDTYTNQLERVRTDASSLAAKVLERDHAMSALQQQLGLTRDSKAAQLQSTESKLETKIQQLAAAEAELQERERELSAARAQLQATQRSLVASQTDRDSNRSSAETSAQALAGAQEKMVALQDELRQIRHDCETAQAEVRSSYEQMRALRETVTFAEGNVEHMATSLRSALAGRSSAGHAGLQGREANAVPVPLLRNASTTLVSTIPLLEELSNLLVGELQRQDKAIEEAGGGATNLQLQLSAAQEELKMTDAKLKLAQDGLAAKRDEVARLQSALRRKEADCEAIEAEIAAQIRDYQRLKERLIQQERDSSSLSADQDGLLRRADELSTALAAKQEECALLGRKGAQLEEQLQAGRAAMSALQERVRGLEAQCQQAVQGQRAATASLEAVRSQARSATQQAATYREQLEQRGNEIRELNTMLAAWESMRLGKDAQIAALMERCKRHEEDAAEKGRTVEALRRKLQALGAAAGRMSLAGISGATGDSPSSSTATQPAQQQQSGPPQQPTASGGAASYASGMGARHIHVHMHGPGMAVSPAASTAGSHPSRR